MTKPKAGRPRSEKARKAILEAARVLLDESSGQGLTIEAIAKRAGVGKPTIYRWWPSLPDVVLEALLMQAEERIPVPENGNLRENLRAFLNRSMQTIDEGSGVHLKYLMGQAQQDQGFQQRFRENFTAKRQEALLSIFESAQASGEIQYVQAPKLLVDVVFGAMWYRLLIGHASMDQEFADDLTALVMAVANESG